MTVARVGAQATHAEVEHSALMGITDQEFALFQRLISKEAGIHLSTAKRALLVSRLAGRLRVLGLTSFSAYYRRVTDGGDEAERVRMLDCICTNETHFFREPKHFELLERQVIPAMAAAAAAGRRPHRVRVWSAACSTGEEPYSLAMTLLHHLPQTAGWSIDILATDLSTRVLDRARHAVWRIEKASEIPAPYLKEFMLKGTGSQEGNMKADAALRAAVRFQRLNLNGDTYDVKGPFDLILCRNVLIYFSADSKRQVVERLLSYLAPTGYFFVGHAESLHGVTDRVRSVIPTVYTLKSAAPGSSKSA